MSEDKVMFVLVEPSTFVLAVFDTFEAAALFADSHRKVPWMPAATWECVMTRPGHGSRWVKMLFDIDAEEVGYEGGEYAIVSVPAFIGER